VTDKERDRLIEAGEELKLQRTREKCVRAVVEVKGREWAPGRFMRDRYFIVNIPKSEIAQNAWENAARYIDNRTCYPMFFELAMGGKYEVARVCHFIRDGSEDIEEIGQ